MYHGDYHTHTHYSDGVSKVIENVNRALEKGLKELAFTDHGFNNPSYGALTRKTFIQQKREIEEARKYADGRLTIYHGVEADIIGLDGQIDLKDQELAEMETLLLGYHSFSRAAGVYDWLKIYGSTFKSLVFKPSKKTIETNTKTLIAAIKRYPIDIMAHINHLYKVDCYEVAKCCADYGTYIELNNKHMNLSDEDFQKVIDSGAKLIASSDAHHFSKVGEFNKIEILLEKHNIDRNILENYKKTPEFPRKKERIKE